MYSGIKITGTNFCIKKIQSIEDAIKSDDLKKYIAEKAIAVINRDAEKKLQTNKNYISSNKYKINNDSIIIYNDVQDGNGQYYSLIIEYGSGIYAEMPHIGSTPTFINTNYLYWLVPVEKGSSLFNTDFDIVTINGLDYFKVYGQTAKHIYEDSAKVIERNLTRWVSGYIKKYIGGK